MGHVLACCCRPPCLRRAPTRVVPSGVDGADGGAVGKAAFDSYVKQEDDAGALRGVNLGGWLIVERWMNQELFRGTSANSEFCLCAELGDRAEERFRQHRDTWLTIEDFRDIKAAGLESVRLPFGYWILDVPGLERRPSTSARGSSPDDGDTEPEPDRRWILEARPYVGPCEHYIQQALDWAEEVGLTVNLCLHGAPGGQNGHDACGFSDAAWQPHRWDEATTLRCLGRLAAVFGNHRALEAITVLNEPCSSIATRRLVNFYVDAYAVIRKHTDVTVVMPVYQRVWWWMRWWGWFPPPHFENVAYDVHLYQCFGFLWQRFCGLRQTLSSARTGCGHSPSLDAVLNSGHDAIVSEWSLRLPEWDASWPVAKAMRDLGEAEAAKVYKEYAANQQSQFERAQAWYFWTWKVDASDANCGRGEPHWDMRECLRRGWLVL
eukprot:TRINITY_DN74497_c0_g1_i1.p1 TRINITY_DN74497_c0_g1~~TRINITY_DN74497_c0_g1_i1.p1  ORF type:complete len:456 (-),score=74.67 TRINITY_DN74497_c0_g1_i1:95-1399(-)